MSKDHYAPLRHTLEEAPTHWRSVEHRNRDAAVTGNIENEFLSEPTAQDGFNRRDALKLAGASLALGALSGCDRLPMRRPKEEILPFVHQPENVIPGVRLMYATAMARSEGALGLLVEAHEGRPTKIEGNPMHPASLGATDIWAQAEVLKLYDPDRARAPLQGGKSATWEAWDAFAKDHFTQAAAAQGKGLFFLVGDEGGPTFERLLKSAQAKLPEAKVVRADPLAPDHAVLGTELAFGAGARAHYELTRARVIFSLDSDFMTQGPDHTRLAREFGATRAVTSKDDVAQMNRLYASEGLFTVTGTNADHRLRLPSGQQVDVLKALAKALAANGVDLGEVAAGVEGAALPEKANAFVNALAKDLAANKGAAAIFVGERQPPAVHALGLALNVALGGLNATLRITQGEAVARTPRAEGLKSLKAALDAGQVETLVVIGLNPAYTAPGGVALGASLSKAKTLVHADVLPEETGATATWHVPLAHFLESWADAGAWDGTVSLVQPLILPLHGGRTATSLVAQVAGETETGDKALLEGTWRGAGLPLEGVKAWRKALHDGVVPSTARPPIAEPPMNGAAIATALGAVKASAPTKDALELAAVTGHLLDGRLSNVSWLLELPDSMSKLCWDNAIVLSPRTAADLGIGSKVHFNGYEADVVTLTAEGRSVTGPTFVLPGMADNVLAVTKGFGRAWGDLSKGVGFDVSPLLGEGDVLQGVSLKKTGSTQVLCSTQDHFSVPGNPFRQMTFAEMTKEAGDARERKLGLGSRQLWRQAPGKEFAEGKDEAIREGDMPKELQSALPVPPANPTKPLQPTDQIEYVGQQWGMAIDLSSCIGCNVCAVACVAENNIPVVGREQVLLGREMHWMRIDRYFSGDVEEPQAMHQPLNCAHCENAPCEPVCPVSATVHDEEGLNGMAYNRCIGTRYCSNNCPLKVRRFNYLDFTHTGNVYVEPEWQKRMQTLKLQRNPDVTVRYRGTMEKCTYCTQRIEEAKIAAKRKGEDRKALKDGAVTPACAQACPTQAITFGNINDPQSRVAKLKQGPRNYEMLQELNIRPRTTFLARIRNANEELA